MRIIDPGHHTTPATHSSPTPTPPTGTAESLNIPATATPLVERLSLLFADAGLDVPPAEAQILADTLAAQGFSTGEMTPLAVLRALLLHRNGVSPSAGIVSAPATPGASLLPEAARLLDAASALFAELSASGDPDGTLRALIDTLSTLLGTETPLAPGTVPLADDVARAFSRNGLSFEWRLLAWYRAGRDPGALSTLVRDDLKGALLAFLGGMDSRDKTNPKLKALDDHARALIDRITGRQADHLTENTAERRSLFGEVPLGQPEERMYAGIRAKRDHPGDSAPRTDRYTLALDIETTRLGPVRTRLRFIGRNVAATFMLRDRETITLAESMADEFREMLRSRGYEPVLIRFTTATERVPYPNDSPPRSGIMNRRG